MSYLVDTNIFSELCKKPALQNRGVNNWIQKTPAKKLYTSVLVLGELEQGVLRLHRREPLQAQALQIKIAHIKQHYRRALPVDFATVKCWARLNCPNPLPVIDSLLAATALIHGFTLVTRNVKDFTRTGVAVLNPFTSIEQ